MSSPPDPNPRAPSSAAVARYREHAQLAIHEENRRWDAGIGLWRGLFVGVFLGVTLIPLAALLPISSVDVLGVVLAMAAAAGGYGLRRARVAPPARPIATRVENVAQQDAFDEHRGRLLAIEAEVETLRRSGKDPREISERALQQANVAHSSLHERLALLAASHTPPTSPVSSVLPVSATPVRSSSTPHPTPSGAAPAIPDDLVAAQRAHTLVPFIGAGLSLGSDVRGNFPRWNELPMRILGEFKSYHWRGDHDQRTIRNLFREPDGANPGHEQDITMPLQEMLVKLDLLKHRLGPDYAGVVTKIFRPDDVQPGAAHRAVLALDAPFVLTTNYDQVFEVLVGSTVRQVYTWRQSARALIDVQDRRRVLFKVHGSAEDVDSVVLTASEYASVRQDPAYRTVVNHLLSGNTFLFIGYGMSDPSDLDIILEENATALRGRMPHFALLHRDQAGTLRQDELRRKYNVVAIPMADHSQILPFLTALAAA